MFVSTKKQINFMSVG